jgi:hypothetical protein
MGFNSGFKMLNDPVLNVLMFILQFNALLTGYLDRPITFHYCTYQQHPGLILEKFRKQNLIRRDCLKYYFMEVTSYGTNNKMYT